MKNFSFIYALILISGLLLIACRTIPEHAVAVKPFDKQKYLGKWYEIARLDYKYERGLDNVTADYSLKSNGMIKVINTGNKHTTGNWKQSTGKAKSVSNPEEGKLKVSFFGPFYAGYNVIAIEGNYKYALVAGKNLKYLWLLSREKTIPEEVKKKFLEQATAIGYKTDNLIWVKQDKSM